MNVEIDHKKTVGEIYEFLHKLQLKIMHEYHVTMVFGVYAVDYDGEYIRELRKTIADFVGSREHVKSFHAVYIDQRSDKIYCDFIVDYELKDWEELKKEFEQYMAEKYTGKEVVLTIETEYV